MKAIEYTPAGYWDRRYRDGRTSGAGSEGDEGAYKAEYLSRFLADHDVKTVVDWGCGDGQVLELVEFPQQTQYIGVDVSPTIVKRMRERFDGPRCLFHTPDSFANGTRTQLELALSFDVLFHFPDDTDYFSYLLKLFGSAEKHVMIYSTNYAGGRTARHVFRREFTPDIAERFPNWELRTVETPLREGLASFFVYEKVSLCGSL
jgi:SAM-dependent methyltransferase